MKKHDNIAPQVRRRHCGRVFLVVLAVISLTAYRSGAVEPDKDAQPAKMIDLETANEFHHRMGKAATHIKSSLLVTYSGPLSAPTNSVGVRSDVHNSWYIGLQKEGDGPVDFVAEILVWAEPKEDGVAVYRGRSATLYITVVRVRRGARMDENLPELGNKTIVETLQQLVKGHSD